MAAAPPARALIEQHRRHRHRGPRFPQRPPVSPQRERPARLADTEPSPPRHLGPTVLTHHRGAACRRRAPSRVRSLSASLFLFFSSFLPSAPLPVFAPPDLEVNARTGRDAAPVPPSLKAPRRAALYAFPARSDLLRCGRVFWRGALPAAFALNNFRLRIQ